MAHDWGTYVCSGLCLKANRPIPGLLPQNPDTPPDVRIWFEERPPWANEASDSSGRLRYESPGSGDHGTPTLRVIDLGRSCQTRFQYRDGTEFTLNSEGTRVWVKWIEPFTLEDAVTYLLGPIVGWLLRIRGVVPLHASAVAIDNHAVAFIGPAGSGKSTTAAGFAESGFPVLADDLLAIQDRDGGIFATPGYPLLRLWPESAELLFSSPDALPLLTPNWSKRYLDLTQPKYTFGDRALSLGAIYLLEDPRDDRPVPFTEEVSGPEAIVALVTNTYLNYLLNRTMRAREFVFLGKLLRAAPLRRLSAAHYLDQMVDLCPAITEDFRALAASRS